MPSIRRSSSFAALGSLAVAGVLFAAPVAARPGHGPVPDPGFEPTAEMLAVRALKKQIAAEELVVALELSPPQRSRLVPVIESAVAMRDDAREARAEAAAGFKPLLERYLQEVRANGAPSEATLEAMRGQREAMKGGREGKKESRQAMGEQLREILTEAQRETLGTFRPMAAVGPDPERKEAREERRGERRARSA